MILHAVPRSIGLQRRIEYINLRFLSESGANLAAGVQAHDSMLAGWRAGGDGVHKKGQGIGVLGGDAHRIEHSTGAQKSAQS